MALLNISQLSIHFTIDKVINESFDELIKNECLNKSLLIQTLIEKYNKNIKLWKLKNLKRIIIEDQQ